MNELSMFFFSKNDFFSLWDHFENDLQISVSEKMQENVRNNQF